MDWISIIGGIASVVGAVISIWQCCQAEKAKEASEAAQKATEAARDKIFQNIQYEGFASFQNECGKFEVFLQKASKGKGSQGKSADYVEDELEAFITKFNVEVSKTYGEERKKMQTQYEALCSKRNTVGAGNRNAILLLLDDVRCLKRFIADIQMKNKLSV